MAARFRTNRSPEAEGEPGELVDPRSGIKCYLPGVPRATYMPQPFEFCKSASQIFIAYQYAGAVRNIYLKDRAAGGFWMGQSVGHWEGRRWWSALPGLTTTPGLTVRGIFTVTHCTWSNGTGAPVRM
jgi:hypothetical protein